jgi:arabinogalactan endo-1,4-beta-galactosidase
MNTRIFIAAYLFLQATLAGAQQTEADFVKGADVGFLTGQERLGQKFHDIHGNERDCLELLKNDYQMSAIRMRVWVNPRGGSCDKNELLAMAKRVKALGMDLMVDFHYSDWWADPAKQPIPKAWLGHSFEEMKQDLRQHTIDVLSLLKDNGIKPRWVQVGNETTNGMLWSVKTDERGWEIKDSLGHTTITHSMGHIKTEPQQYAGFIRTGYDAVKEVFPDAIVIVHLDRGHKKDIYDYNLDTLLKYGGKFDMIGMSLYPYWAKEEHPELKADDIISDCIKNIRYVSGKYGCDVMIVETGYEVDEAHPDVMEEGRRQLSRVIHEAQECTGGHCRGVFYWEPQCRPGGYKLCAFDSNGKPTAIMNGFIEK